MEIKRVHVIINPASGQPQPVLHILNAVFRRFGIDWDVSLTKKYGDAQKFAISAVESGVDVVAAYGGDGTVMEVASALVGYDTPMAILPGGTANVLSVELGIPHKLADAACIASGEYASVRSIDVGKFGDKFFLLRVAIGFGADMVIGATREIKDRFGKFSYSMAALQQLRTLEKAHYRLTLDGHVFEMDGVACTIDNSGNFGLPVLKHAPDVSVSDGLLDVFLLRDLSLKSVKSVVASIADQQPDPKNVQHWQASEITIEADPQQYVVGDGELWGQTPVQVIILPKAVKILVGMLAH